MSAPLPELITSIPEPGSIVSALTLPVIISAPEPPLIVHVMSASATVVVAVAPGLISIA